MIERSDTSPCVVVRRVLCEHLEALSVFTAELSDETYNDVSAGGSSIGAHVRHSLDHFRAFLDGIGAGVIDYEDRHRGGAEETSAAAASALLRDLAQRAEALHDAELSRPVEVRNIIDAELPAVSLHSDGLREAWFVVSHSIHHNSLIARIAADVDVTVPQGFGYAPSTLAYLARR